MFGRRYDCQFCHASRTAKKRTSTSGLGWGLFFGCMPLVLLGILFPPLWLLAFVMFVVALFCHVSRMHCRQCGATWRL